MHSVSIASALALASFLAPAITDPLSQYTSRNSKTGLTRSINSRNPFPMPLNAGEDCLLSNQLAWDITCPGASDTDCSACICDNDCKVRQCDNVKDQNGKLCSSNCQCTPDGNASANPTAGDGGANEDGKGTSTSTVSEPDEDTRAGSSGTGGNLEDGGE